ncbi:TPA: hypothetical protein EYP83_04450 [Candidatus Geothermarchaeota archaeon]|nr:hypothetical protein [Candidatus Geothermarchaeota archaeon]HIQ13270.1 hypothetical protein [Thermoprotei archaeon]
MKKTIKITINVDLDKTFREIAKKKYVGRGYYSKAIEDAIKLWINREKKAYIVYRNIQLLEKGVEMKI